MISNFESVVVKSMYRHSFATKSLDFSLPSLIPPPGFQYGRYVACSQEDPDRSIADVRPTGGRALPTPPDKEITATSAGCAAFPVEPRRTLTDATVA